MECEFDHASQSFGELGMRVVNFNFPTSRQREAQPQFTKTEGSLPCAQKPAAAVHPEADRFIPRPDNRFLYNSTNIILPIKLGLPGEVLPSDFSTKAVYALLLSPICAICHPVSYLI